MGQAIFVAPAPTLSSAYQFYLPVTQQKAADGGSFLLDLSGKSNNVNLESGTTYAAALATAGWATITSSTAAAKPTGTGFSKTGLLSNWDMSQGQHFLLAFEFKSGSAATPSVSAQLAGYSPATGFKGVHMEITTAGKAYLWVTDGTNFVITGSIGANICDGAAHSIVVLINGVTKTLTVSIDGGRQYVGSIAAVTGSTSQVTTSFAFGNTGAPNASGTFDSGATPTLASVLIRNVHGIVTSGTLVDANVLDYIEGAGNLYRGIPAALIP